MCRPLLLASTRPSRLTTASRCGVERNAGSSLPLRGADRDVTAGDPDEAEPL